MKKALVAWVCLFGLTGWAWAGDNGSPERDVIRFELGRVALVLPFQDAEVVSLYDLIGKKGLDFLGRGVCGKVPVISSLAKNQVADRAADQIDFKPFFAKLVHKVIHRFW